MSVVKEFRDFISRGNVVDLAVALIIGVAFGKVVSSAVADIIMPPIGYLIGGVNFTDIKFILKDAVLGPQGEVIKAAVTLNVGNFLQAIFDFLIVAFAVFMVVKAVNRFKRKQAVAPDPIPTKEQILLTEIRDVLKSK